MTTSRMQELNQIYTDRLNVRMTACHIATYRALAQQAHVSEKQLRYLRRGKIQNLRLQSAGQIAQALGTSIEVLFTEFSSLASIPASAIAPVANTSATSSELQQEYERITAQLETQRAVLLQEFQQTTLQTLEPLLRQWPTAAFAAHHNPQLSALKLLPLLSPIEQLLRVWNVSTIGAVGAELIYDPTQHQLLSGSAECGDRVRVRYVGYCQGDRLLYRAQVSLSESK